MKHLLNNLSEEEKNSIREQHAKGGMKVVNENFSKLLNSKLGDSKPLVSEEPESSNYGKEYLGDKALKYLIDTLKPFGFVKKYPFTKKDDYAGSPVLKQILSDLGQWKTYKPSDRPEDYGPY